MCRTCHTPTAASPMAPAPVEKGGRKRQRSIAGLRPDGGSFVVLVNSDDATHVGQIIRAAAQGFDRRGALGMASPSWTPGSRILDALDKADSPLGTFCCTSCRAPRSAYSDGFVVPHTRGSFASRRDWCSLATGSPSAIYRSDPEEKVDPLAQERSQWLPSYETRPRTMRRPMSG
jgi:hypothetical protein